MNRYNELDPTTQAAIDRLVNALASAPTTPPGDPWHIRIDGWTDRIHTLTRKALQ